MNVKVRATGDLLGHAGRQLLSNNIEAYENTIPAMLSDRLRNAKFSGPENPQTGIAAEWEPIGNGMAGMACRLVPGMYLSGRESQLIHNYRQKNHGGILQAGIHVHDGEEFEIEIWARVHHRPAPVFVELCLPGQATPEPCRNDMLVDLAHWHRYTCRLSSPGKSHDAILKITVPGDSRLILDQIHLRPVGETHVSKALLESFGEFPCPVLRFPGGCESCTYHWEHGIGPVHLRPVCDDPVFKYKVHYDFGTDEYLELCTARGIRPFITLNTTTATPEEAGAWAAYVRDWYTTRQMPVPSAYFMFGNENYGVWEIGHMTGDMYVAQLREFVPCVRNAYPEAQMLAIGEFDSGGLRDGQTTPWRSTVLEQAADLFDVLVVTRYSSGSDDLGLAGSMECVADNVAAKAADLQEQARTIRESGLDRTMAIVEWNYWTRASHNDHAGFYEPNDIRHCLYAAGYLNAFCRLGEILEMANFYSLVNTMGMIHSHDGKVELSNLVKVFNLYADALPGDVLALDVDAPVLTTKSKAVDANLLRSGDNTYGFLVNFSTSEVAEVELSGLGRITDVRALAATDILATVSEIHPEWSATTVDLPPMSIVRATI